MKRYFLLLLVLLGTLSAVAAPKTEIYAIKGADTLRMDFYAVDKADAPCMIFMFGGGFFTGRRDKPEYIEFFEYLNREGYAVASIDYRLGLAPLRAAKERPSVGELVGMLSNSVDIAVKDLYSATTYLVDNAARLGISPEKIVTCGSSAGAISVLTGEWRRTNGKAELPKGFRYAGVISLAGAVYSTEGAPKWESDPCPLMLYHGDADSNVPYRTLKVGKVGMFGTDYIYDKLLKRSDMPYYIGIYHDVDHVVAGAPYMQNREQICWFMEKVALGGRKFQVVEQVRDLAYPAKTPPRTIFDYIKANFGG